MYRLFRAQDRFDAFANSSLESGIGIGRAKSLLEACNRSAIHISLLALFLYGGYLVNSGQLPIGVLLTAIGFTFSMVFATQGLVNTLADMRKASAALENIEIALAGADSPRKKKSISSDSPTTSGHHVDDDVDDDDEVRNDRPGDAAFCLRPRDAAVRYDLVLRDVDFAYPARQRVQVLRGLSLTLKAGKITALVGKSGSGKSTIASLVAGFYPPSVGKVSIGGYNIEDFSKEEWSNAVSLVSQEPVLFSGTIADNIAYGLPYVDATMDQIKAAALAANAAEFIDRLPDGYQTYVGAKGTALSGGQRQRIAIARAIIKDAPILILDEATSALDSVSERLVQEALERLIVGRTVLVIAHRLSTVQKADKIIVVTEGTIGEQGTHDDLVSGGGLYASLVDAQRLAFSSVGS